MWRVFFEITKWKTLLLYPYWMASPLPSQSRSHSHRTNQTPLHQQVRPNISELPKIHYQFGDVPTAIRWSTSRLAVESAIGLATSKHFWPRAPFPNGDAKKFQLLFRKNKYEQLDRRLTCDIFKYKKLEPTPTLCKTKSAMDQPVLHSSRSMV